MKLFLLVAALVLPLAAQTPVQQTNPCIQQACFYGTTSATVAASGTTTLTIQQPASAARAVNFMSAVVTCNGQTFSIDQAQNGTAATATAGNAVALLPIQQTQGGGNVTAAAKVWTASNVGAGTATAPTLPFPSGAIAVIDLSMRSMLVSGTANNYSLTLTNTGGSACTGTVTVYWSERI